MKVSLNWLKEFVDVAVEPRALKKALTGVGLNVESITEAGDDRILEVEVTTNRPDCLSHYGVAREVAAIYGKALRGPEIRLQESARPASSEVSVEIADPDLCARYCGRIVENVIVRPSPPWLTARLEAVGLRPINNVADVTNYVLMELGHPLHAFDLARLEGRKIIVRRARAGERLRTLDGADRALAAENLAIADARRPVALAGVMGGRESEISSATRSVLLESAWFLPASVRRTAKSLGLHTEASHRFERGADIDMAPRALDRAAALISELAGGEVLRGVVDVYARPWTPPEIALRATAIRRLLGAEIPSSEVERNLASLGFKVERRDSEGWRVTPPSFRLDVMREVDLIEEVARLFGYDRLPARLRAAPPRVERDLGREKERTVYDVLVGLGYREIIPAPMVSPEENARFTGRPPVVLANPLSQEASAMRSTAVPSILRALRWNLDRDQRDLRLFEIGKTYTARPEGLPEELRVLTLGLSGARRPATLREAAQPLDFFDLKGDLATLFEAFDARELRFEPVGCHYYNPARAGQFLARTEPIAVFGEINPVVAREYKLRQTVWLVEVDLDRLLALPPKTRTFRPFSKFPAVQRDLSLVVPEGVRYSQIDDALRGLGIAEIQPFRPVERQTSAELPPGTLPQGQYSLLVRVTFQSPSRTLTSEEISAASERVVAALEPLGARLRS